MSDLPILMSLFGNEIKENVCQLQLCYESNETSDFSVPVAYVKNVKSKGGQR